MPGIFAFCRCVGEAVLAKGARCLAGLAPFGDHLYDIAADALKRWRDRRIVAQVAGDLPVKDEGART